MHYSFFMWLVFDHLDQVQYDQKSGRYRVEKVGNLRLFNENVYVRLTTATASATPTFC